MFGQPEMFNLDRDRAKREHTMGTAGQAGKMFGAPGFWGAALASQLGGLPPEQEAMLAAQQSAQKRVGEMDPNEWGKMDSGQKSRKYSRFLAEEFFRNGLYNEGSQLFAQVEAQTAEADKHQAELERVGAAAKRDRVESEVDQYKLDRAKFTARRGEMAEVFPKGSNNPNSGVNAFIDDAGNAHAGGKVLPLGSYTTARPNEPNGSGSGGRGKARDYYSPTAMEKMRGTQRDVMAQMRAAERISGIMAGAFKDTGSIDILGTAGTGSAMVAKVIDEVSAVGRAFSKATGNPYSRSVVIEDASGEAKFRHDGSQRSAEQIADTLSDAEFRIPNSLRKDETAVRRYKAAMINLAYAIARAEEPGNPRLSDDDFKRNLAQLADSTGSPETLRQVILDRINTSIADFDIMYKQIHPQFRSEIFNDEANKEYEKQSTSFFDIYNKPFGTGGNPGPGLTGEDDPNVRDLGDNVTVRFD